ncbi:MAG: molecular chaperone [Clostridium sp. SCN 57-10]|nr:MAG: molecular chaperone [Clostridium sp. SCN 57-10]
MGDNGRHEHKHRISYPDYVQLRARLKYIMKPDENAAEQDGYRVRSLYFDNYSDKAVVEKLAGLSRREKFRIRLYNNDTSLIRLEKKSKINLLCYKESAVLSAEQCSELLNGRLDALRVPECPLCMELYAKMQFQNLRPRTIVDYRREAYIYPAGNVRVTFDSYIRMSNQVGGLLDPGLVTIPSASGIVLEVKYDGFIPEMIRELVQVGDRSQTEFSKYAVSRLVN